ncbi:MAG TPA: SGNH/GDSL hydrolase family protein [Candidatus Angelobacter sp.]|nr:SGNH/GDSL hydrolase family protein [Candidatus Angelobacter sp.]
MARNKLSKFYSVIGIIFVCLTAQFVSLILPIKLNAESDSVVWSWVDNKPTVFSSNKVQNIGSSICPRLLETMTIVGESVPKKVCIMAGDDVQFGVYYFGSGSAYLPAVGFAYDSKMYKVNGVCGRYDSCLYLPDTDTLVTKQYLINGLVRSLVLYKNFTQRLTPVIKGIIPTLSYDFDASNPDYVFKNADGYAWPIGGFGASDNGRWLAIEYRQKGIGLLNIDTLQMKRVSTLSFSYGTGYDPKSELAVSDDGESVVIMGVNAGLTVFDVSSECGDEVTDARMSSKSPIAQPCRTARINSEDFIYRLRNATNPRFNGDGGELGFFATSYVGEMREVSLRAAGYGSMRLDYLALGDSFSSGEGESDDSYYLNGTNDEYEKCHLSTRSYPYIVSNLSSIDPNYMKSVACSGATTEDIIGSDTLYLGQGERLGANNLNLNDGDRILAQTWAKENFLPGRVHQESFVKKYSPKVITIGIGGNDAGFMQKLVACLGPDTCDWAGTAEGREQTAIEIKNLFGTLVQTYQALHIASPGSKIYAISYPNIIEVDGDCDLLTGLLLDESERQFMNQGISYLNEVIAAAAKSVGIKYVDIQDSYGGHVICGAESPGAMNLIRLGDDISPINSLDWFKVIGQESFHPNLLGHTYMAGSIVESVGNIMTYDYCVGGINICPGSSLAPEPSTYWLPGTYHNYPAQKIASYVFDRDGASDNRQKELVLTNGSLTPGSSVVVEITSDPRLLGQFEATSDGALNVDVDLPIDLEEGYHTVHLYGTSYSGESVELYQVIEYKKPYVAPESPPLDEDNIIDDTTSETSDTGNIDDADNTNEENNTNSESVDSTDDTDDTDSVNDADDTNVTDNQGDIVSEENNNDTNSLDNSDITNDENDTDKKDIINSFVPSKASKPGIVSVVKPGSNQNDGVITIDDANNADDMEWSDRSIAMASEPMVEGSSTVLGESSGLTDMVTDKNKNVVAPNYVMIGVLCAIAITSTVLIVRKLKTRV